MRYLKLFEDLDLGYERLLVQVTMDELIEDACNFDVNSRDYKALFDLGFRFRNSQFRGTRSILFLDKSSNFLPLKKCMCIN